MAAPSVSGETPQTSGRMFVRRSDRPEGLLRNQRCIVLAGNGPGRLLRPVSAASDRYAELNSDLTCACVNDRADVLAAQSSPSSSAVVLAIGTFLFVVSFVLFDSQLISAARFEGSWNGLYSADR